jgi:integrase
MATIRKRIGKKGITWQIDYYDPGGKRRMKCFALRKDAEAYLGKIQATMKEGRYHQVFEARKESQITFGELADHYEENYRTQKSYMTFKCHVVKVLRAKFGARRLNEITYLDLETFKNIWKATPIKSGTKARADATVNRYLAVLGHILNKAVEWQLLEVSPFRKGSRLTIKENNQRDRFLTEQEIEALLNSCNAYLLPIVEVALRTGMRKGELLALQWGQIKGGLIYLRETKSKRPRQIPIDDRVAQVFKELQIKNKWRSPFVFLGPDGKPLGDVKKSFLGACRRAEIEDFRFHDLRHTCASHLIMKGASIKAVQKLLGHAESRTTDRYSHLAPDHLREAVNLLSNFPTGKEMVNILPLPTAKCGAGMGIRTPDLLITNQLLYH